MVSFRHIDRVISRRVVFSADQNRPVNMQRTFVVVEFTRRIVLDSSSAGDYDIAITDLVAALRKCPTEIRLHIPLESIFRLAARFDTGHFSAWEAIDLLAALRLGMLQMCLTMELFKSNQPRLHRLNRLVEGIEPLLDDLVGQCLLAA